MGENAATKNHHHQVFDISIDVLPHQNTSKCFDDDGRLKRTGTVWTASAHIITAVIGSGVLSLAWAIAQLGWIAGPAVMFLFSFVIYYTSSLLADCYRSGDPVSGKRNYTYMDAVKVCGLIQYLNIFGVAIGYTIAASISMINPYMIMFGIAEIAFSQIPDFDQIWWLSIVAGGSLTGISIGTVTQTQKIWRSFQALGDIAFAYSYSIILIEIQSPPSESKTMKKATSVNIAVTTAFYMLCGCMGYAAFGDLAPGNLLTRFGFYNPFGSWILQILLPATFRLHWEMGSPKWPHGDFSTKEIKIPIPGCSPYSLNLFRLVWRSAFVVATTIISMLLPFFNEVVGILGAFGFWPLTVYFPVELYIMLGAACLIISIAAAAGSIAGVVLYLKVYHPFKTSY
ncbi:hypothetical protein AAG906_019416 [Vitis piasezkii]